METITDKLPFYQNQQLAINYTFFIMQQERPPQEEFIFCSDSKNPESLVMLASSQHIFDILLTDSEEPFYFWIYQIQVNVAEVIKSMPKQIQQHSYVFESFKLMNDFCVEKNFKKIIIICPPEKSKESLQLTRSKQFIGVLLYSTEKMENIQQFSNQESILSFSSFANIQDSTIKNQRLIQCDSLEDLQQAFSLNQWILCQAKQFSNFVSIKNQVKQSKGYVRSLASMLNHQVTQQTRAQIIDNLSIIATKLLKCHPRLQNSYSPLKQALDEMKASQLDPNKAFKFYTCQNYRLYVFVNIFLRAMTCSTQIYYFQPFFKDLFTAIVAMSRGKQAIYENRQLVCYRGGLISSEEVQILLESVGEIVQNLGFLSTSLCEQTAATFKRNIIFKIMVPCLKNGYHYNHGYANIKVMSEFSSEQQVLFNPLNYFKIMEIKIHSLISMNSLQYEKEYEISLDYGQAERIHQLPDSLLTQSQIINKILIGLHKDMEKDIKTQADIFRYSESKNELEKGLIYNQMYLSSAIGQSQSCIKANYNMGHLYESFGKCKQALLFYEESLRICEEKGTNGERSQQLYLQALNGKADCLNQEGSYKEAYRLYIQIAATYKELMSDQDSNYISLIIKIAQVMIKLGKIEEAKNLYKQNEHIIEAAVKSKHPKYFPVLQGTINILSNLGKYEQALSLHNRFSIILRQVLGEQHPDYLSALHNLANLYLVSGKNQESLVLYNKCEKARQFILGQRHPDYLTTLHNKASLLINMGKFQQAIAVSLKCQDTRKQLLGDRHPDYLNTAKVTANGAFYQGKFKQALELYNKIQATQKEMIGEMHPDYLSTLSDIADVLVALKRNEEALFFYKRCLVLRKQVMGENHPKYLNTLSSIATVKFYQGLYNQALEIYQVYKTVSEELFGVRHPNYLATLYNIANVLLRLQQFEKALLLYRQVEIIQKQVLGVRHPEYISTLHNMSEALLGIGQSKQVLQMCMRFQPLFFQKEVYRNQFELLCVKANCQLGDYFNVKIQELTKAEGHSFEEIFPVLHKILLDHGKYRDVNILTKSIIRQLKKPLIRSKQSKYTTNKDKMEIMAKIRYCKQKQADTYAKMKEIRRKKKYTKSYFDF